MTTDNRSQRCSGFCGLVWNNPWTDDPTDFLVMFRRFSTVTMLLLLESPYCRSIPTSLRMSC